MARDDMRVVVEASRSDQGQRPLVVGAEVTARIEVTGKLNHPADAVALMRAAVEEARQTLGLNVTDMAVKVGPADAG